MLQPSRQRRQRKLAFARTIVVALTAILGAAATHGQTFVPATPAMASASQPQIGFSLPAPGPNAPPAVLRWQPAVAAARYSKQSGLNVTCLSGVTGEYGYVPLEITVGAQKATVDDRELRFRFAMGGWQSRGQDIAVEQTFTLPAGATTGVYRMLAPRLTDWQYGHWQAWVDGRPDDELQLSNLPIIGGSSGVRTTVISVGTQLIDTNTANEIQAASALGGSWTQEVAQPQELPENWLEYTSIDLVVLQAKQLVDLTADEPRRAQSLRRWIRSGGNLWITESDEKWTALSNVAKALDIKDATNEAAWPESSGKTLPPGWRPAPLAMENDGPLQGLLALRRSAPAEPDPGRPDAAGASQSRPANPRETNRFIVMPYGLGLVTAFPGRLNGLNRNSMYMGWDSGNLLNRSDSVTRLSWRARHGLSPSEPSLEFNNWLIPGVGMAPVTMFQFLITLFVIGVGPVNYFLLARRRRLPLLLLTAPAAAIVAVGLLFAYGLLTDGVATRVRARSVTLLDQGAGQAATWSRLSYYAGMAPAGGLTMPDDVAIYPILPEWASDRSRRGALRREMEWTDQQRLVQGWLPSRTPTQFLTVSSRSSPGRLIVREGGQGVQVENQLGVDVQALALQDGQGRLYWTEEIARDGTVRLEPVEWSTVAMKLRGVFADHEPTYPAGGDPTGGAPSYYAYAGQLSTGLLEVQLAAMIEPTIHELGNCTYIAVTDRGMNLDLGRPAGEITEEASFHVVRGTW
ncbi:MAG: hypothetical protein KDA44_19480 [Planctomycetales bacterium]|nr:hypothetical protein [Planctomycetales bacterium]